MPTIQKINHQALADDGVGALSQPRLRQQLGNLLQAHPLPIEQVLVGTVAVGTAGNGHFTIIDRQPAAFVIEGNRRRCHPRPRAQFRAGKDHVFSLTPAQQTVGLFAQHPAQ
jgi:hypothetical protein